MREEQDVPLERLEDGPGLCGVGVLLIKLKIRPSGRNKTMKFEFSTELRIA